MSSQEFSGKVVLITGAGSGIGKATAIHFSKLGANLSLIGRTLENLKKTQDECSSSPKILTISADLANSDDIKKIVDKTIQEFGKLDVLVNNAASYSLGTLETAKLEDFDNIFNTNVRAVFQLTQLAIPYLKASKGNIVNVSSLSGLRSFPQTLAYCMSKSALDQFTQCVSLELAPHQVRVNSVNPAVIETGNAIWTKEQYQEFLGKMAKTHPIGRVGQPEEVAEAISFLASDKSSFITGVLLPISGGKHNLCPR